MRRWLCPPSRVRCKVRHFPWQTERPARPAAAIAAGASPDHMFDSLARLLSPAPAIIVSRTCASKLSPSSSTAAIPPWAQPVAPSLSLPLAITPTLQARGARLIAAVPNPAAPDPTTMHVKNARRSSIGVRLSGQAQEYVLKIRIARRNIDNAQAFAVVARRAPSPAFTLSFRYVISIVRRAGDAQSRSKQAASGAPLRSRSTVDHHRLVLSLGDQCRVSAHWRSAGRG